MAVRISFLSCFAPEKAKDACKIMGLEEHGVKYVMEFNPPVLNLTILIGLKVFDK